MFGEYWLEFDGFKYLVENSLNKGVYKNDTQDTTCFRSLRNNMKTWSKRYSNLSNITNNYRCVLSLLDGL
jgi:hypothetical protein